VNLFNLLANAAEPNLHWTTGFWAVFEKFIWRDVGFIPILKQHPNPSRQERELLGGLVGDLRWGKSNRDLRVMPKMKKGHHRWTAKDV
jgi:hypothetical protein